MNSVFTDLQNCIFLGLQISVLFFEEGAEKIHHGDALGDGLELDRSMQGFGDVEGESFHFDAFDRGGSGGEGSSGGQRG